MFCKLIIYKIKQNPNFMPEKEPNINRKDLKSEGKLTADEAKAMVQRFKKEHEGLLPEHFSLPGE